jgi:hypothetical protein
MKRIRTITILVLAFSCSIFGQNSESNKTKAQEILAKAKEAISKKRKPQEIKGLSMTSVVTRHSSVKLHSGQPVEINDAIQSESNFELQNLKIREKEVTNQTNIVRNMSDSTQIVEESVLNGENFSYTRNDFVEGEKVKVPIPTVSKEQSILYLKDSVFPKSFPVTLDSWYRPLKFYYVGIAESKDGRANVIEAANDKTIYRLFFDEKTNLLLLMSQTWVDDKNNKYERKYYYSNYQEMDGLLVAAKIKVEILQPNGKIIEVREIKDLKINPTFKSNFF